MTGECLSQGQPTSKSFVGAVVLLFLVLVEQVGNTPRMPSQSAAAFDDRTIVSLCTAAAVLV